MGREGRRREYIKTQKLMQKWRQCTNNVIMRHVQLNIVAVEEQ
jgi:hypothetical protein